MWLAVVLFSFLLNVIPDIGNAATWFVRPIADCAYSGNGAAYECAPSSGQRGAFRDTSAVNWNPLNGVAPGDTLYVCGQHLHGMQVATAGTETQRVTISFSCPGNNGRIIQRVIHADALQEQNWAQPLPYIWYIANPYINKPYRLWINMQEQVASESKDYLGTQVSPTGPFRTWWYDALNKHIYIYSRGNPAQYILEMRSLASSNSNCMYAAICLTVSNHHIDIVNPDLQGGGLGAVYIAGSSYIRIFGDHKTRCSIGAWGARGITMSDSSVSGVGTSAHHNEVYNCVIDPYVSPGLDGMTHELNGTTGDGIVLSQGADDNYFHDLTIRNWQHSMVNIVGTVGTLPLQRNVFEYITYECSDYVEYCRAFSVDGNSLDRVSGNVFRSSVISNMTVRSQLNGNANIVEKNYFKHQRNGTVLKGPLTIAQVLEFEGYAGPSQDNVVRGNVFFGNRISPCVSFRPNARLLSGHRIEKNIFINCGGVDGNYTALFMPEHINLGSNTVRENTFIGADPIYYRSVGKTSVSQFEAACTSDQCSGNQEALLTSFPIITDGGCLLGFLWEMGGQRPTEYICVK